MNYKKLADLLLPNINKGIEYYEELFPKRDLPEGAKVTRLAPSPTGFIHLGNLYGAFADERLAHQSGGTFYLRIEDTDDKRYVDGAVDIIIKSLEYFGLNFDEGATIDGQIGDYGDYFQSNRGEIYQCFAKHLIESGMAYPCFLTPEELNNIHSKQESLKENFGIYGKWAISRNLTYDEIENNIKNNKPYVIRLRSDGDLTLPKDKIKMITVNDGIRGKLVIPENDQDIVILKANGIPTYHFAHAIDDHFMRTTHVIRGAEWLSSLPIHVELFEKLGFEMPIFCHTAQLMKIGEDGNKRKLSKRKDPELSLDYYRELGYHPDSVREYLMTILNSDFEEWRIANPDAPINDFEFTVEKMGVSGALFDLDKLNNISKSVLVKKSAEEIYDFLCGWSKEFEPEFYNIIKDRKDYMCKILDIGRSGDKPRKDLIYAKQIMEFISYFFDELFVVKDGFNKDISLEDVSNILDDYLESFSIEDSQDEWFSKLKLIGERYGFAQKPKEYKKNPTQYKGYIGHVSGLIRVSITGREQSPDIWEIQQILGKEIVTQRINKAKQASNY